jgi:uncharacterized membrane protein
MKINSRIWLLPAIAAVIFSVGASRNGSESYFAILEGVLLAVVILGTLAVICHAVVQAVLNDLGGESGYAKALAEAIVSGDLSMTILKSQEDTASLLATLGEVKQRSADIVSDTHISSK